jgi:hypothetical protein
MGFYGVARVGAAFRRAPRSPALTVDPVGIPARLPSGFPKLNRMSVERGGERGGEAVGE